MAKQKLWVHPRRRIVRNIVAASLRPCSRWKYGIAVELFANQTDRPYLILYNHQTAFVQFFVGIAFPGAMYYLASEICSPMEGSSLLFGGW